MQNRRMVSTIIPVYNCERYLAEAIESVLAQTYRPIEVIVVDDGSTDRSAEVAKAFADREVRYFYQRNSGLGAARNQGTRLACGSYFAFLDSDDVWVEKKLDVQMAAFDAHPELDMVFGNMTQFVSPELAVHAKAKGERDQKILTGYSACTLLIKRSSFLRVGPFATGWRVGEFIDWYSARPFEIVQVDLKYIRDHKALTREQIIHLDRYNIPNYQWSALDVNSRFKLIAYSREKSWT